MVLTELLSSATLLVAAVGSALGGGLALAHHLWRDQDWILARWEHWRSRTKGEPVGPFEPPEDFSYDDNPVTDEDRRKLPLTVTAMAIGGGLIAVWLETNNPWLLLVVAAFAPLKAALDALLESSADVLDIDEMERPPSPSFRKRLANVGAAFAALVFAVVTVVAPEDAFEIVGLTAPDPQVLFQGFWVVAFFVAAVVWGWRQGSGPPDEMDDWERKAWDRDTAFALAFAIAVAAIAAIVWLT